ncbi:hypothetical protein L211DRAFT_850775 [Terfezia boudieri ATCC MYA-4762]|uniref:Uncharacterized protein n=1 Tax=Terfezia boudieri ATCC MYA-4762 TaxID=1051890 RepID=A0A3N4LLJ2_9PEZI|nr:hypothetical protein L211DRAFT_850775 [Terfezia boudieri ATCC MYA-4762]
MVHKKDKTKSRTKSKQQKGFFSRIFRKVFSCIAPPNENLKPASRRLRRTPESPKQEWLRDRFEQVRTSLRGPSRGHKEGPRRRPLFETSLYSARRHEARLDSESHQGPTLQAIPLFVPIFEAPGYSAEEASAPMRCTSSETHYNNALVASQYAHALAIEAPKLSPGDPECLLPIDDVHIGTFQSSNLPDACATESDNGLQDVIGLGIQNISCELPTIADQENFTIPDSVERSLSRASSTASDTGATIGESSSRSQGRLKGVPGFNSLPRYRLAPKLAPDPMWRAPCPAPMPPEWGNDSDSSSASSSHTINKSAASSASSLPMQTHSSYAREPYPGLPKVDRLYIRSVGPIEPGNISAWTYVFPMPAFMLPTMFTPPPSSHTLGDTQPGFNDMLIDPEESRVYLVKPRRNGAQRKRERRALGSGGSTTFVKKDIRVTVDGHRAKQQNRKNSTTPLAMGFLVEVPRIVPYPRAKARSKRSWKEREGTKFGGIRDGKENLVLAVARGTIERDSTSHQYGKAGRSLRTRAEMQPTVESAPTSVVSSVV